MVSLIHSTTVHAKNIAIDITLRSIRQKTQTEKTIHIINKLFSFKPLRLDIKRRLTSRSDRVKSVDLHPSEPWMLCALYNGHVHVMNYENQQMVKDFEVRFGGKYRKYSLKLDVF
jgi:hypothetical protein